MQRQVLVVCQKYYLIFVSHFLLFCWFTFWLVLFWCKDVAQERTQQALIKGVEDFDTKKLKHTNTVEKIVLPDKEGTTRCFNFYFYLIAHQHP
jgi:hypothetical protein